MKLHQRLQIQGQLLLVITLHHALYESREYPDDNHHYMVAPIFFLNTISWKNYWKQDAKYVGQVLSYSYANCNFSEKLLNCLVC